MRQIVLDTETTGLDPQQGHRVIEIGCVEIQNRRLTGRHFHYYLNPERDIDEAAIEVHGLTRDFLSNKPRFRQIAQEFLGFVSDAELVIHNAPFDIGFLNAELQHMHASVERMEDVCSVLDSLLLAREKHPGQRNSLDALCKRYGVDNAKRELHGALLDAEILADVYLLMTSGQSSLSLRDDDEDDTGGRAVIRELDPDRPPLPVITANADELAAHQARLREIADSSGDNCLWLELEATVGEA